MPVPSSLPGRLAVSLLAPVAALVVLRLYPHELPTARHPDLLAVVFYSRAIVFAGRVTVLCLAAFAVLSIAARIARREWLLRAGPFEVERAAAISEREKGELKAELAEWRATVKRLEMAMAAQEDEQAAVIARLAAISSHDQGDRDAAH